MRRVGAVVRSSRELRSRKICLHPGERGRDVLPENAFRRVAGQRPADEVLEPDIMSCATLGSTSRKQTKPQDNALCAAASWPDARTMIPAAAAHDRSAPASAQPNRMQCPRRKRRARVYIALRILLRYPTANHKLRRTPGEKFEGSKRPVAGIGRHDFGMRRSPQPR